MPKHRSYSTDFKRQIAQEFLAGETLHGLAKRRVISRNLIRIWVEKYGKRCSDRTFHFVDEAARVTALSISSWPYAYEQAVPRTR